MISLLIRLNWMVLAILVAATGLFMWLRHGDAPPPEAMPALPRADVAAVEPQIWTVPARNLFADDGVHWVPPETDDDTPEPAEPDRRVQGVLVFGDRVLMFTDGPGAPAWQVAPDRPIELDRARNRRIETVRRAIAGSGGTIPVLETEERSTPRR